MITSCTAYTAECDFSQEIAGHGGDELIVYKHAGFKPLYLSIYYPQIRDCAKDGWPILLFVHGGGWQSKKVFPEQAHWSGDYLGYLARYYTERGYLCVSIDYRLLDPAKIDQSVGLIDLYEDCMDAAEYVCSHANDWKADAGHMIVLGESAGGYLAAAMVTLPFRARDVFSGAILVNAITDLTDERWNRSLACESVHPLLAGKDMAQRIDMLSPCANIGSDLVPVLLLHGDQDSCVAPQHSARFYETALAFGNNVELDWIAGEEHAFLLAEYMYEKARSLGGTCAGVRCIDSWLARH